MDLQEFFPVSEFYHLTPSRIFDKVKCVEYLKCRFCNTTFEVEEALEGFTCACERIYTIKGNLMRVEIDSFTKSWEDEDAEVQEWEEEIRQNDFKKKVSKYNRNNF